MLRGTLDIYLKLDIIPLKELRLHHHSTSRARLRIAKKESLPETTPNVIHINHIPRVGDQSKAVGEPHGTGQRSDRHTQAMPWSSRRRRIRPSSSKRAKVFPMKELTLMDMRPVFDPYRDNVPGVVAFVHWGRGIPL